MLYKTYVRTFTNVFVIFGQIFLGKIKCFVNALLILPINMFPKIMKIFVGVRTYVSYTIFQNHYNRSKTIGLSANCMTNCFRLRFYSNRCLLFTSVDSACNQVQVDAHGAPDHVVV